MKRGVIPVMIFILLMSECVSKADTIPQYFIGSDFCYGFIIPHSRAIEPVSHTNPFGVEATFNKLHCSVYNRRVFNAYWISGCKLGYFNYQNPSVLGSSFTLTLFAEPVVFFRDKFMITFRGGAGFSYNTRYYDEDSNPTNQFFCTPLSFNLYVSPGIKLLLTDHLFMVLSGTYNHISNGGIRQPNYGMNFPIVAVGIEYYKEPFRNLSRDFHDPNNSSRKTLSYVFELSSAFRVMDKTDEFPEKKVLSAGFHTRISKPLGHIYSLNAGLEVILDGYIREQVKREESYADFKRAAITAGQDFKFGRVFLTQYFGYYVYSPYSPKHLIYQKYELAYRFKNGIMPGVFLKAHLYNAEMMGFTLSYMFTGRNKKA